MQEPQSVPKELNLDPWLDYTFLKKEGINFSQNLSGDIWTDYNDHDPGVTILEQLCYAMTELGYKTNFDMEDLLFAKSKEKYDFSKNVLFPAVDIFPCAPLTLDDYRRLVIDHCYPDVRNVWLLPVEQSVLGLNNKGLYKVFLHVEEGAEPEDVRHRVFKLLQQHRNLGEDFDDIILLQPQKITLHADVEIQPDAIGETVLASILFDVREFLTPQIRFETFRDLFEEERPLEEIFNGPPPIHGIVYTEDLKATQLKRIQRVFRASLVQTIAQVEGVSLLNNLKIKLGDKDLTNEEEILISEGFYPELDIQQSRIRLFVGNLEYAPDQATIEYLFHTLVNHQLQYLMTDAVENTLPTFESERNMNEIEDYFSIQHHFPPVYGLNYQGLPSRATAQRKAQVKQLRGYLLPFEQVMASYLSQLVNVRKLFSIEENYNASFYTQMPTSVPDLDLLAEGGMTAFDKEIQTLNQKYDPVLKRQARFLDHLLARFGEEFMMDVFNKINQQAGVYDKEEYARMLNNAKIRYLKNYIDIGRNRFRGYDYSSSSSLDENISGFKKRICLLFSIENYDHRLLSNIVGNANLKLNQAKKGSGTGKPSKKEYNFISDDPKVVENLLLVGLDRNNYSVTEESKNSFFIHFNNSKEGKKQVVYLADTPEEAEEAIDKLVVFWKKLNRGAEGFHIVEHLLLRPVEPGTHQLTLSDGNRKLLEFTRSTQDIEASKKRFAELLRQNGTKADQYLVEEANGEFWIRLRNQLREVVASQGGFKTKSTADKAVKSLMDFVQKYGKDLESYLRSTEATKEGGHFAEDPYSSQITLVLPNWSARFQNENFQQLFEQIVKLHAPVHLLVNCRWIGIQQLHEFEKIYQLWLNEKASLDTNFTKLDAYSLQILNMIKEFGEIASY
jgi:uncharacterized protein YegP (UPF0339 family)